MSPSEGHLLRRIASNFQRHAGNDAVIQNLAGNEERISFSTLWRQAEGWLSVLDRCGNDRLVLIFAKRSISSLALGLACMMSGRAFSFLNNKLQLPQVESAVAQSGATVLWADDTTVALLKKHAGTSAILLRTRILFLRDANWGSFQDRQLKSLSRELDTSLVDYDVGAMPDELVGYHKSGDTPAVCLFTSGSTGKPKGVLVSARDLCVRADSEMCCFGLIGGSRILNVLPWSFDVGLSQVLCTLLGGCTLVIIDSWLPADIVAFSKRYAVEGISAVPSVWLDMLAADLAFAEPMPRYITVSGGSLPADRLDALRAVASRCEIIRTYGQTETCRSTVGFNGDLEDRDGSIGRAYIGARVYIVDENLGRAPAGQEGELMHTGDGTMLAYLDGNDSKKRIENPFRGVNGDSSEFAILTGDMASMDAQGYIFLRGRRDDLIKVKGNRVFLSEVRAVALSVDDIVDAEVIAQRAANDTMIILFVVLQEDIPECDARGVMKLLSTRLPPYMMPSTVHLLRKLPRVSNGKPDRRRLIEIAQSEPG